MLQLLSPLSFTSILLEEFEGVVDRLYVYACTINRTFVHYKLSSSLYTANIECCVVINRDLPCGVVLSRQNVVSTSTTKK